MFRFIIPIVLAACAPAAWGQTPAGNAAIYAYQGADRAERLAAGARKEGALVLYTSLATSESVPLTQAFEKKYGVKVELWRSLSDQVMRRALNEARARRHTVDVIETNAPEVEALARARSPDVGCRPLRFLRGRFQHRQSPARRASRDLRGLSRSEVERANRPRGDRPGVARGAGKALGREARSGFFPPPRGDAARRAPRSCAALGDGLRRRGARQPHQLRFQRRLDETQGQADRLETGRAGHRQAAGARPRRRGAASARRAAVRRFRAVPRGAAPVRFHGTVSREREGQEQAGDFPLSDARPRGADRRG